MASQEQIEGPAQLGERFRSELRELVDLGEISPAFAQRITNDLFEAGEAGDDMSLRSSTWFRYIEDFVRQAH